MSPSTHVMAPMTAMPSSFSDRAWVERENRANAVPSHESVPQLVNSKKRGRKGAAAPTAKLETVVTPRGNGRSHTDHRKHEEGQDLLGHRRHEDVGL
ncbi:hypothetical protein BGZ68_006963 [Mortierella alpina]|nr:hypothetical protein BGZ68_006963 [Mortierella alpina]